MVWLREEIENLGHIRDTGRSLLFNVQDAVFVTEVDIHGAILIRMHYTIIFRQVRVPEYLINLFGVVTIYSIPVNSRYLIHFKILFIVFH